CDLNVVQHEAVCSQPVPDLAYPVRGAVRGRGVDDDGAGALLVEPAEVDPTRAGDDRQERDGTLASGTAAFRVSGTRVEARVALGPDRAGAHDDRVGQRAQDTEHALVRR